MSAAPDLFTDSGATFSDCRTYRYRLHRTWDAGKPPCAFIMLNPSTATEAVLDPTVRRCVGYAMAWGYGGLIVGNVFALRSTDPRALYAAADPIGPANDDALAEIAQAAGLVVCAWGKHGHYKRRGNQVMNLLRRLAIRPHALKLNGDGSPGHPLYLRGDARPFEVTG